MRLSDLNIEINVDRIVLKELKYLRQTFEDDLKEIEETGEGAGYISWDADEDEKEIKKEVKALNRVIKLYDPSK